jgi:hypothetical protein
MIPPPAAARLGACALALFLAGGCASRFMPPRGTPSPVQDSDRVWTDAMESCRGLIASRAELSLSGRAGNRRIPGLASARIGVAVNNTGAIALEARVAGQLAFTLSGTPERATLLLVGDKRVVVARPDEILEALVGVRLSPERMLRLLGGCLVAGSPSRVELVDDLVRATTAEGVLYLAERDGRWQVRAGEIDGFLVDYRRMGPDGPRTIGLYSEAGGASSVALTIGVEARDVNPVLDPSLFTVNVPGDTTPLTIEELRASGPTTPSR